MKLVTQAEVESVKVVKNLTKIRHEKVSELIEMLNSLELGAGILVDKTEWTLRTNPDKVFQAYKKLFGEKKFSSARLEDGTGWLLKRIA